MLSDHDVHMAVVGCQDSAHCLLTPTACTATTPPTKPYTPPCPCRSHRFVLPQSTSPITTINPAPIRIINDISQVAVHRLNSAVLLTSEEDTKSTSRDPPIRFTNDQLVYRQQFAVPALSLRGPDPLDRETATDPNPNPIPNTQHGDFFFFHDLIFLDAT
ncbi:uncharacterized protein BDW47DRAFT_84972 [Aspergillus candidus]|uniref:Uncharacterized protein n=1 Tax=Aspergillus candidus TaxID=41067 RepID=A0A2I2F016_ASPCN|nr:hypothetical protein BDW47DRAFT_84972 [Aspergillus candidus]PLB33960.1 hypothetical protein BDW47DRAFT_84972 [Aspergillus candidus]